MRKRGLEVATSNPLVLPPGRSAGHCGPLEAWALEAYLVPGPILGAAGPALLLCYLLYLVPCLYCIPV